MSADSTNLPARTNTDVDSIVVTIAGEIDMARDGELLELVMTLDPLPDTIVEVDMSDVTFVDSRGLDSIIKTTAYLDGRRCQLHLIGPQKQFLKLVALVGLADVVTVVDVPGANGENITQS
jgi:anti-anti-sigma factor